MSQKVLFLIFLTQGSSPIVILLDIFIFLSAGKYIEKLIDNRTFLAFTAFISIPW